MPEPTDNPDDPTKVWYDRSSLKGEFMVMIPDQTREDNFLRALENQICEYLDGIVYMPSPASLQHQSDVLFLSFLLRGFIAKRPVGRLMSAPACLGIGEDRFVEPDLFVIPPDLARKLGGFFVDPPILLVIEVLFKSTRSHDLSRKVDLYRQLHVEEVWFVDDRERVLIVHRRTAEGYQIECLKVGNYLCRSLPGFWIDVEWLWTESEPDVVECLRAILAGPPA